MMLYKCKKIYKYKILWNKKINHTCYHLYPIKIGNQTSFFELKTRRILDFSNSIKCDNRPQETYIQDKNQFFWKFTEQSNFTLLPRSHKTAHYKVHLPKLAEFNRKLLHYKKSRPHRNTLLKMLSEQTNNLDKLSDFQTKGGGNLLNGIISEISDSVGFLTDTGESLLDHIISDVDKTVSTISNSTENIIDSTANGLSKVLSHIGIPSLTLLIIQIGVCGYLLYLRYRINQCMSLIPRGHEPPIIFRERKPFIPESPGLH